MDDSKDTGVTGAKDAPSSAPVSSNAAPPTVTNEPVVALGTAPLVSDDDSVDTLPHGAALAGGPISADPAAAVDASTILHPFTDEFVGQGGSYVVGEDGVRRPAYEQFTIKDDNKSVTKYRQIK
jgi:hypothetical protein